MPRIFDNIALPLLDSLRGTLGVSERAKLRAELDGRIAHLYGLTEDEFTHILATFPLVPHEAKDAALDAYVAYADTAAQEESENAGPPSEEALLRALIAGLETDTVEFKIGARWNPHRNAADDTMRDNIVQAVAAFLNSEQGGALLIGVAPNGTLAGLEADFAAVNAQHPGPDSYDRFLRSLIGDRGGGDCGLLCRVTFPALDGKTLCRIDVRPADVPVYLGGDLYVRDSAGKRKLNVQDAVAYLFAPQTMMDMGGDGGRDEGAK